MACEERVNAADYREVLRDYVVAEPEVSNDVYDYCRVTVDSNLNIVYYRPGPGPANDIMPFPYYEIPKCYGLMQQGEGDNGQEFDSLALSASGILQLQQPPLSLTGQGVIIGFIDTGIRYTQDVFRDGSGDTRILAIWDQTIPDGGRPEGFLYGTEYGSEQINAALASETPREIVPSWDTDGHGTEIGRAHV